MTGQPPYQPCPAGAVHGNDACPLAPLPRLPPCPVCSAILLGMEGGPPGILQVCCGAAPMQDVVRAAGAG